MEKHYYDVRCELCNKFITEKEQSDDGLCAECADRLEWMASRRLSRWQIATYALAIANLVLIFWR